MFSSADDGAEFEVSKIALPTVLSSFQESECKNKKELDDSIPQY